MGGPPVLPRCRAYLGSWGTGRVYANVQQGTIFNMTSAGVGEVVDPTALELHYTLHSEDVDTTAIPNWGMFIHLNFPFPQVQGQADSASMVSLSLASLAGLVALAL